MATKKHNRRKTEAECGPQQNDWEQDSAELRAFLLEAVEGNHTPFKFGELKERGERVLRECKKTG